MYTDFLNELDNFQASNGREGEGGGEGVRRRRGSECGAEGAPEEEVDYTPEQKEAVER